MTIALPFKLFHADHFVGDIVTYSYETPWAYGPLAPISESISRHYATICHYLEWLEELETEPADSDALYERVHQQAAPLPEALSHFWDDWTIRVQDGIQQSLGSPPVFDTRGVIEWRW